MKKFCCLFIFISFFFISCVTTGEIKSEKVSFANKRLEKMLEGYILYPELVKRGFDIHSLDYVTDEYEIFEALEPYWFDEDGRSLDNHFNMETELSYHQPYSRYSVVDFRDIFGNKEELLSKGYVENETMFYYPSHGEKDWRVGKIELKDCCSAYNTFHKGVKNGFMDKDFKKSFYIDEINDVCFVKICEFKKDDAYSKLSSCSKNKKAVIVDLTTCNGGSAEASKLLSEKIKKLNKKTYILTSNLTASAAETLTLSLKDIPNIKLIGINTAGTHKTGFHLENNNTNVVKQIKSLNLFYIRIPNMINNETDDIESIGIYPNYWSMNVNDTIATINWDFGEDIISYDEIMSLLKTY